MVARNLLFLGVCAGAVVAVWGSVVSWPNHRAKPVVTLDLDSIRPTVRRVDATFRETWRAQGLTPADAVPDLTVVRRIALGLTGTIPSLEEIRRFESWAAGDRIERWLGETLADRRYADFVAERLARAYVGVDDGPFLLYRRRRFVSWLSDQLAANQPYDTVVGHLIADSGLWTDTPATNFITVAIQPGGDTGPDPNKLAARVGRAFLGVRLDCAECHDHPFEPWTQRDFQGLAAFFANTQQGLRGILDVAGANQVEKRETSDVEAVGCGVPYQPELLPDDGTRRHRLAAWVTHPANKPFAREAANRAWALLFGRPLAEPIDNLGIEAPASPVLDILADDFAAHDFDFRRLLAVIASTEAFRLDSKLDGAQDDGATSAGEAAWAVFPLTRLRPEQVVGALLQSASLSTIDSSSHIVVRFARAVGQNEFVGRYGDTGADEFDFHGGTIPQRLLMMNGKIVHEKTKDSLLANAATRIAVLAPDDSAAVETAMLAVLTRRPGESELRHFRNRLARSTGATRKARLGDLYWTLLNSTEFSWNH